MTRARVYSGFWSLPGLAHHIPGQFAAYFDEGLRLTLLLDDAGASHLNLGLGRMPLYPRVVGRTVEQQWITLLDCQSVSISTGRIIELELRARAALVGAELSPSDDPRFASAELEFDNLRDWCQIGGFTQSGTLSAPDVTFRAPPTRTSQADGWTLSLWHSVEGTALARQNVMLRQVSRFEISVPSPLNIEEWRRDFVQPLRHLLTFGTGRASHVTRLLLAPRPPTESDGETIVEALLPGDHAAESDRLSIAQDLVLCLPDIWDDFGLAIVRWLAFTRPLDHVLALLLGPDYQPNAGPRSHFLDVAHGLEAYHRARGPGTHEPDEEHADRLGRIRDAVTPSDRRWLAEKLKYSHEPSFRQRLKSLLGDAGECLDLLVKRSQFVERVRATRNFLVHNDPREAARAAQGLELEGVAILLRFLARGCLLRELGLDRERRLRLLRRNFEWSLLASEHERGTLRY